MGLMMLSLNMLFSQDAAQWRGPNRDGNYNETGLLKIWPEGGPKLLWHFDELGQGFSSAAIAGERIYTSGIINGIGNIFCFSMDGKLLWKVPYGEEWTESTPGVRSTPVINDGKIYLLSGFGKLVCRKADDGTFIWAVDLQKDMDGINIRWGYTENLLIDGNKLFCAPGGTEYNVVALDKNTGKLIWKCKGKGEKSAYCSPAIIRLPKRSILVTMMENSILGIDAASGTLLWSHEQTNTYSVHANTPLFHEGYVFCSSGYGRGGVMLKLSDDGSSVTEVWRNASMDNKMGGYVLVNGLLYGADDEGKAWYCLDWKTGKVVYSNNITAKGNIIFADGMLYCYGEKGEIVLAMPSAIGFSRICGFNVPYGSDQYWAHLVIYKGRMYVRHGNSLMVYDIKNQGFPR
jgi:outer membrane protein assembly factor BamB